jgi:DNA polymerase (family 10)
MSKTKMFSFTNQEVSKILREVAAAYEIKGESRFRIRAYERAADAVEQARMEVKDLWEEGKLKDVPGIGAGIAQHLDELFRTGKVRHFKAQFKGLPEAMFPLLDVPGIGPKTAFRLSKEINLQNKDTVFDDLIKALQSHKVAGLEGFGEKSERELLEALLDYKNRKDRSGRIPYPLAQNTAQKYLDYLLQSPDIQAAASLGSLRRRAATVGDVDLAVVSENGRKAIDYFTAYPLVEKVIEAGKEKASVILKNRIQVDLKVSLPSTYGSLLQHFTGSKHHNIRLRELALAKGMSLSEHGIKQGGKLLSFADEVSFYEYLGLPWIPPELREDRGEIEAALGNRLPKLISAADVKGDFHIHSDFDIEPSHDLGRDPLEELIKTAYSLGYEYIGIADHNPSVSKHSPQDIISIIKARNSYIDQVLSICEERERRTLKLHVFKMLEVDILADGSLSVPDAGLAELDGAIASIHTAFSQSRAEMTRRVLGAISHPKVKIIGHPTGRLLQKREGIDLDWDEVFAACLKHDVALEINAQPSRLDLPETLVREAVKRGLKLTLGSDAHAAGELTAMKYGLAMARRGWAEKGDIVNSRSEKEVARWLAGPD